MGAKRKGERHALALKTVMQINRMEAAIHEYKMKNTSKKRVVHDYVCTSLSSFTSFIFINKSPGN